MSSFGIFLMLCGVVLLSIVGILWLREEPTRQVTMPDWGPRSYAWRPQSMIPFPVGSDLSGAYVGGADLSGANLLGADLTIPSPAEVVRSIFDKLPPSPFLAC